MLATCAASRQAAVALGIGGDAVMVLAAIGAGNEMFAAILDPAHRMAAMHGEPTETNLLRQQNALIAKSAANVRRDDADLSLVKTETLGQPGAHDVRHLTSRVDRQLLEPRVPEGDNAAPLDRRHALPSGADLARDLDRRVERLADIDIEERLEKDVVGPVLVDQRNAVLARFQHVVNGRQFLELERHRRGKVLGVRPRRGDAHGDQLADMANLVGGERRLLRHLEAAQTRHRANRLHADEISRRERAVALIGRDGNAANAGVREGAADEGDVVHCRQPNVGNELPATAHEAIIFLSAEASSNTLREHCAFCRGWGLHFGVAAIAVPGTGAAFVEAGAEVEWASRSMCSRTTSLR